MRPTSDIETAIDAYGDAVWRVCMLHFKNQADAEDAFQETFIKYSLSDEKKFGGGEHVKAWLIRVAQNQCRDMLRSMKRHASPAPDDALLKSAPARDDSEGQAARMDIIEAMRALDDPPRTPLYLSICEGYSAVEIAEMTDAPVNTVYSWISRGKKLMREALG